MDVLLGCGEPGLWQGCWQSAQWAGLHEIFQRVRAAYRAVWGMGARLPWGAGHAAILHSAVARRAIASMLRGFDEIRCRDQASQQILAGAGVSSALSICPSAWSWLWQPPRKKAARLSMALIFEDPVRATPETQPDGAPARIAAFIQRFLRTHRVHAFCFSEEDRGLTAGIPVRVQRLRSPAQLLHALTRAEKILTTHVPSALIGAARGAYAQIIPVDSRCEAAALAGAHLLHAPQAGDDASRSEPASIGRSL